MQRKLHSPLGLFLILLLLGALACSVGGVELPGGAVPEGAAATAEGAAAMAATAVARVTIPAGAVETAQAAAGQAGGLAATAVALAGPEGGNLLATLEASGFDVDVTVNVEPLRDKVANAQPDENGNITITFTEEELNQAITLREGEAMEQTLDLQEPLLSFSDGNVLLTGQIQRPIRGELRATFQPAVETGQLRFNLTAASIGGIAMPTAVLGAVEAALNTSLATVTAGLPADYTLTDINVRDGSLTVVARANQ